MSALFLSFLLKVQGLCDRHFVADDAWPYAEASNLELVGAYMIKGSEGTRAELRFRLASGQITAAEISRLRQEIDQQGE